MKEEANKNKMEGTWAQDKDAIHCKNCNKEFNITRRKV